MNALLTNTATILTSLLSMISSVFEWVIDEPVIMFFMGFAVIGLVINYARRLKGF